MKWLAYDLAFLLVFPFLLPGFLLRMCRRGGYAARLADRIALYPAEVRARFGFCGAHGSPPASDWVWIHAVSVGEVQVAGQLMREWRALDPRVRFCFSTTSSTGWKTAEKVVLPQDALIYNPLDFPNFVKSALRTVRPRAIILTESELWPCFIRKARRYGIPLFLINARVSDRSAPRYRAARLWFGDVLSSFTRIYAQSTLDRERLLAAGAPADRTVVTGSFKFDVAHRDAAKESELLAWAYGAAGRPAGARILLGGSTWPGEDRVLIDIYRRLRDKPRLGESLTLILAPRHFEKADAVEQTARAAGFACTRRSRGEPCARGAVNICDTTGELMGLYGLADVVFVGKSLCAHGSQNMIEPCLCGKPTLVGPYTENFRPVMSDLLEAKALVQVSDAAALERAITDILEKGDGGLGARATAAVARRRGVVAACVASIRECLS